MQQRAGVVRLVATVGSTGEGSPCVHGALDFHPSREARGGGGSAPPRCVYQRADQYAGLMRTNLSVEDLGSFLDEPRVAVLATLRVDGTVRDR